MQKIVVHYLAATSRGAVILVTPNLSSKDDEVKDRKLGYIKSFAKETPYGQHFLATIMCIQRGASELFKTN